MNLKPPNSDARIRIITGSGRVSVFGIEIINKIRFSEASHDHALMLCVRPHNRPPSRRIPAPSRSVGVGESASSDGPVAQHLPLHLPRVRETLAQARRICTSAWRTLSAGLVDTASRQAASSRSLVNAGCVPTSLMPGLCLVDHFSIFDKTSNYPVVRIEYIGFLAVKRDHGGSHLQVMGLVRTGAYRDRSDINQRRGACPRQRTGPVPDFHSSFIRRQTSRLRARIAID